MSNGCLEGKTGKCVTGRIADVKMMIMAAVEEQERISSVRFDSSRKIVIVHLVLDLRVLLGLFVGVLVGKHIFVFDQTKNCVCS